MYTNMYLPDYYFVTLMTSSLDTVVNLFIEF